MDGDLKISVVMCTYNGVRYLRPQLDSVLAQTLRPCEIIVQDDGSDDGTWALLEEYAARCPMLRLYRNESGRHGINGNFFSAMARAQGDYIAVCDQDDIWEADKLAVQARAIGTNWLCSAFSEPFSEDGYPVQVDRRIPNTHLLRNVYICELPGHSMLFRRELLDRMGGDADSILWYDTQLACAAAALEGIVFVPRVLVHFRRHAGAATASVPVGGKDLRGAGGYLWYCVKHHGALQAQVRRRFRTVLPMLEGWGMESPSMAAALEMSRLQLGRGWPNFVRKVAFFVRHGRYLHHAEERRPVVRLVRALLFVFTCGYYYRKYI
ncbi:MAG: glycosyltransferase [Bacteroidaceae bacterium]|nr:glycosyltransferase [Bacteroidaceae bacterium]